MAVLLRGCPYIQESGALVSLAMLLLLLLLLLLKQQLPPVGNVAAAAAAGSCWQGVCRWCWLLLSNILGCRLLSLTKSFFFNLRCGSVAVCCSPVVSSYSYIQKASVFSLPVVALDTAFSYVRSSVAVCCSYTSSAILCVYSNVWLGSVKNQVLCWFPVALLWLVLAVVAAPTYNAGQFLRTGCSVASSTYIQ